MKKFLVTYKKLGPNHLVQMDSYDPCLTILDSKGDILDSNFEQDSKGKLHLHVVYLYWTKPDNTFKIKGFHMNIREIIDEADVPYIRAYIHKKCHDKRVRLLKYYYVLSE